MLSFAEHKWLTYGIDHQDEFQYCRINWEEKGANKKCLRLSPEFIEMGLLILVEATKVLSVSIISNLNGLLCFLIKKQTHCRICKD